MTAALLYRQAIVSGVTMRLAGGALKATGSNEALAELIPLLREHKPELIQFLQEAHDSTDALIAAAMKACDHHNDSEAAREAMRLDCLSTPPHLREDLLDHLSRYYGTL